MIDSDLHTLKIYQADYFEIVNEFFINATGKSHEEFCVPSEFSIAVNRLGEELKADSSRSNRAKQSFATLESKLRRLYGNESIECFKSAKNISYYKVNLGGSSRFLETQLNATRKSLLVTDIVLIPDPIMPWLEAEREHEKFKSVHLLEAAYFILHLTDLLSNEFDLPPFLIFPSWEKSLEELDEQTMSSINQLIADFFSHYIDNGIAGIEDAFEFADIKEEVFLNKVENRNLFIAPGGNIGDSLEYSIATYLDEAKLWRTADFNKILSETSAGHIVLNGILERIQPQYHLIENSSELKSNPLLSIEAQAHYFMLIAKMTNKRVDIISSAENNTQAILAALMNRRLDFLTNIESQQLVTLRKTDENIRFRQKLRVFIADFPEADVTELDYISSEMCAHIESLISEHEKQISILKGKYRAKHSKSALLASGVLAVTLMPALAPFLGAAVPFAMAAGGKYVADKLDERHEKKVLSNSLLGVFALAKNNSN